MDVSSFFAFYLFTFALLNYLIRPGEDLGRDGYTDLFRGLKINHGFENSWLFDREIGRLGAF